MNAERQAKEAQVKEINAKIIDAKALVIAEYAGLSVQELQALRQEMQAHGVEARIYKNRLFKIAAKQNGLEALNDNLTGPNIYVFGHEDDISPAKILANFAKEHEALKIKAGTFEGKIIDAAGVAEIATLPTLEEALTMLATSLLAPVKYVGSGLHMLATEGHLETNKEDATTKATSDVTPATDATVANESNAHNSQSIETNQNETTPSNEGTN